MRILVTGATGTLGRRALPLLVADGHAVTAVTRRPDAAAWLTSSGAEPAVLDLRDGDALRAALAGHDAVVHLATAIPTGPRAARQSAWRTTALLRTEVSRALVDAARDAGVGRYVGESLAFAYADGGAAWLDEGTPLDPHPLQAAIVDAEASAQRMTDAGGIGVVLRFGALYGPGAAHTRDEVAAARRGWATRPGPPGAYTPAVHLDDAAAAVAAALRLPAGTFHVVDDEPLTRREHADALAWALGVGRLRLPPGAAGRLGPLRALARSHRTSNARLRAASGWQPRHPSAREGWRAVVAELGSPTGPGERTPAVQR